LFIVKKKLYIRLKLLLFAKLILYSQINKINIEKYFYKQEIICIEKDIYIREIVRYCKINKKESCYKNFKYLLNCKDFIVRIRRRKLYINNFNINNNKEFNFILYIVNNILFAKIFLNYLFTFVYKRLI